MSEVTAKMVSELRQRTGAGMMDCKKALVQTSGDMEAAADELRKVGLAKAASKADRIAKDGLIRIFKSSDNHGAMIVLNCETDFVARNDQFQQATDDIATFFSTTELDGERMGKSLTGEQVAPLLELPFKDGMSIGEFITSLVAIIRENIVLGAVAVERSSDANDYLQEYMHGNRVGVLVCFTTGRPETHNAEGFRELARNVAMQVAAAMPAVAVAVSRDDIDQALVEKERKVLLEQALEESSGPNFKGDPQEIAEKKVTGRLNKYFEEVALLDQPYIRDDKQKIRDVISAAEKELGDTIKIARFHRFELGG